MGINDKNECTLNDKALYPPTGKIYETLICISANHFQSFVIS